jgi:hypothetical protein
MGARTRARGAVRCGEIGDGAHGRWEGGGEVIAAERSHAFLAADYGTERDVCREILSLRFLFTSSVAMTGKVQSMVMVGRFS